MHAFPDLKILSQHLSEMLEKEYGPVKIVSRANFIESSTFPVEIVTCKTSEGKILNLFCKYLAGRGPNNFGHRGGVEYEVKFYEHILQNTPLSKIHYFGKCRLSTGGDLLLVIEYIGETLSLPYSTDPDAVVKAANWIGSFHKIHEIKQPDFLTVYDKNYYLIWSDRFRKLANSSFKTFPWLEKFVDYYESNIECLFSSPQTIIHGEFYPKNILLKEGIIYAVDWESAAMAPGEIDLASLIEGWPKDTVEKAKINYIKSRWPNEEIDDDAFNKRILLAQIYFHLWWWEEKVDVSETKKTAPINKLLHLSKKAGIV